MASTHTEARTRRSAVDPQRRRQLTIAAVVVGALVLLVFPLQTILAAMLIGSMWIVTMAMGVWIERNVQARDRNEVLHHLPLVAMALTAVGIVLTFVWPMTMAAVTLLLAIAATGGMAFLAHVERQVKAGAARRDVDGELEQPRRRRAA